MRKLILFGSIRGPIGQGPRLAGRLVLFSLRTLSVSIPTTMDRTTNIARTRPHTNVARRAPIPYRPVLQQSSNTPFARAPTPPDHGEARLQALAGNGPTIMASPTRYVLAMKERLPRRPWQ